MIDVSDTARRPDTAQDGHAGVQESELGVSSTFTQRHTDAEEPLSANPSTRSSTFEPVSRSATISPAPNSILTAVTSPGQPSTADEPKQDADVDNAGLGCREGAEAEATRCSRHNGDTRKSDRMEAVQPRIETEVAGSGYSGPTEATESMPSTPMGLGYATKRSIAVSPCSFLRPGSKFHGTQQSERQVYDVQVEIKHVDMRESFLCGYLKIQGLTEDHPTLTTYFEGEIIGDKYSFHTQHEDWGATPKIDICHWAKFPSFRPYAKPAKKSTVFIEDAAQKETLFMRWKEHFLVPDHRVRTITGASFEGFYYICFNQVKGEVSGIYFHSKSEKFQQLELKHVADRGCFSAMEFR